MAASFFLFFAFLLFRTSLATCKYKFIHNASELIDFSNDVSNGTTYEGYTVYLASDITFNQTFSQQYNPITGFLGTFDGQGYVISNLTVSKSSKSYIGLFGTSSGTTIRNVVIDDSCSFSNSYSYDSDGILMGAILAHCSANSYYCIIENSVNMANINNYGTLGSNVYYGGISGLIHILSNGYGANIINCANYGNVYNSGSSSSGGVYLGGIIAEIYPATSGGYIANCINYGAVTNTGTGSWYRIGGLTGVVWGATLENCMSTGKVTSSVKGEHGALFNIADRYYSTVLNCYWTGDTSCSTYYGRSASNVNDKGIYYASLSSTYANEMNTYASSNKLNGWAFNENSAKITFVVHDGKGFSHSRQFIPLPEPTRRGYAFLFWCVDQNSTSCSNKYVHSDSGFTSASTLYAQWVVTNCTVSFDVNGGYDLPEDEKNRTKVFEQEIGELPVTLRRGYTFGGWFTAYGERFANSSLVNNVCNCSLIAQWIPNNYTVILDVNRGNKLENDTFTVTFDSKYGELPTPTRDGFDFVGWFTQEGEEIINETTVNITSTQTLYARWGPMTYTVTLDVNGGDELPEDEREVEVLADKAHDSLTTPTRRGYTFAGWYTEDNRLITDNTETTAIVTRNQVLRAHWTANNYTVDFDVNGGNELVVEEKNKTVTFNTTYDTLPIPTRTGYTFSDWFTAGGELITNMTTVNISCDHTLYAEWTANNYTIEFDVCGGDGLTEITVTYNTSYDCLPTPVKEGYTFLWWYIKGTNEIVYNKTVVMTTCDHTLCAAWDKNTITFVVNGGDKLDDNEKEKEVTYDEKYDTLPTPTRTGYTFDGWFTESGNEITKDTRVEIVSNQVLHAEWTPNKYTLTLNVNGGDALGEDKNTITVTYDALYGSIPTPTRTGYKFIGWYTENGDLITINTIVTDACHCTLHANWTADTYIIIFDVNGGNELSENERNTTVAYDGTYDFLPEPIRTGYTFDGWLNEDGEEITAGMRVEITKDQTFRAEWTANNYTVRLDANGGELVCEEITVTYNSTYGSLPEPMRGGYDFDGWFNEDGEEVKKETTVTIAKNQTIRAHWSETVSPSKYVEIVFGKGDMTEEEIREILGKFTKADFDVVKIEPSKSDETTIIIRFNNIEDAKAFLTKLSESSDSAKNFIRNAHFNSGVEASISTVSNPFLLLNVLLT